MRYRARLDSRLDGAIGCFEIAHITFEANEDEDLKMRTIEECRALGYEPGFIYEIRCLNERTD